MSVIKIFKQNAESYDIEIDEIFDFENSSISEIQTINPPVSFDNKGVPVSYWNDDIWNFNVFSKKKNDGIVDFNTYKEKLSRNLFQELKLSTLIVGLDKFNSTTNISRTKVIASTISTFFIISNKLKLNSITELSDSLNFELLLKELDGLYTSKTLLQKLIYLRVLENINIKGIPLSLGLSQKKRVFKNYDYSLEELSIKYAKNEGKEVKQTLYIPQRVHSEIVYNSISFVKKYIDNIKNIEKYLEAEYLEYAKALDIVNNNIENKNKTGKEKQLKIKTLRNSPNTNILSGKEILEKYDLHKIFKNPSDLAEQCRMLSTSCIILILTFSGMRIEEVLNIKKDGYKEINSEPKLHIIRSYETKISGGQTVDYITSPIIKDVFEILIRLQSTTVKYDKEIDNKDNLFVSSKNQKLFSYSDKSQIRKNMKNFIKKLNIKLKSEDLKEHKLLNQNSGAYIKEDDFWDLNSHQFRRTLIVNFVSHHLSSVNEVKQQVKHMYATMTEYYAKNSQLIEYFNLNQPENILESIQEELLNENVRKYKDFYYSDNHLAGNKGHEIVKERKIADVLSDEEIKLMFKTGAYKLTKSTYGYCTKGSDCDKAGVVDPTFCGASCETMIITKENAEQWKKLYLRNKKYLDMKDNSLIFGSLNMDSAKTLMKSQNSVAEKILKEFKIEV